MTPTGCFIHIGISAQKSTEDLKGSLDNIIIKESTKEAVRKELTIHSDRIIKLQNMVESFEQKTDENFTDVAGQIIAIEDKLDRGFETVINILKTILTTGENALRNIIVLRSIIYIFLLGHRTGRIEPQNDNISMWQRIIKRTHEHANKLSVIKVN